MVSTFSKECSLRRRSCTEGRYLTDQIKPDRTVDKYWLRVRMADVPNEFSQISYQINVSKLYDLVPTLVKTVHPSERNYNNENMFYSKFNSIQIFPLFNALIRDLKLLLTRTNSILT